MKKSLIALAMLAVGSAASAADVTVGAVRDYNVDRGGVRATVTAQELNVGPVTPFASVTYINDQYTRYAVGGSVPLFTAGAVAVKASVAGVFQDTQAASNGYGLTAGLQASVPLSKSVDLTAGVERFVGQSRVDQFNGNVATVGLNVKF